MKELLRDVIVVLGLLVGAAVFASQAVGDERGAWSGVRGTVIEKGTRTGTKAQFHRLTLRTEEGPRTIYVGNRMMEICMKGDVFERKRGSLLVSCRGESAVDWGGLLYGLAALVFFAGAGFMVVAMVLRRRPV